MTKRYLESFYAERRSRGYDPPRMYSERLTATRRRVTAVMKKHLVSPQFYAHATSGEEKDWYKLRDDIVRLIVRGMPR